MRTIRLFSRKAVGVFLALYMLGIAATVAAEPAAQRPPPYHALTGTWPAGEAEVVEFFSYNCSYCYQARSAVDEFIRRKPSHVRFQRYAINSPNLPGWTLSAVAFRAAYLAGIEDQIGDQLFERMHGKDGAFADLDDVRAFFGGQPLANVTLSHLESPESAALRKHIFNLAKGIQLEKTPTFVISGRYIAYWGTDQTPESFAQMILDLLQRAKSEHPNACSVQVTEEVDHRTEPKEMSACK